jgi:hypothetical protein
MKKLFLSTAVVAALFMQACKNNSQKEQKEVTPVAITEIRPNVDGSYIITGQSMGKVKMGMTKAEVLAMYPAAKEDTVNLEAQLSALAISDVDGTLLFQAIYDEANKIAGFVTENPKMATAQGIKVGSLYPALKENFNDLEFSFSEGLHASSAAANLLFTVEGDVNFKLKDDDITTEVESISPSVKVTSIMIN